MLFMVATRSKNITQGVMERGGKAIHLSTIIIAYTRSAFMGTHVASFFINDVGANIDS